MIFNWCNLFGQAMVLNFQAILIQGMGDLDKFKLAIHEANNGFHVLLVEKSGCYCLSSE